MTPAADRVTKRFIERVSRDFARANLVVSVGSDASSGEELVAVGTPPPTFLGHNLGVRLGSPVRLAEADPEAIALAIDGAYGPADAADATSRAASHAPTLDAGEVDRLVAMADRDLLSTQSKGPVVKLVDALLFEALTMSASDVHVQPLADRTLVRYRLDGVLRTVRSLPRGVTLPVVSRIKVMGRMDIAERRLPQDGRDTVHIGDRHIDLRISTIPTTYGERAVVRLLDHANQLCDFAALGMPPAVHNAFLRCTTRSNGFLLVTGPTGSGRTTTLYSTLRQIGSEAVNIMTIEDPVEYELSTVGVAASQPQTNPRKGVTFATGLRHILRQDPDIVMVGEIRDHETARIAVQAALTGHLVLSTLHTNDAPSAVSRLVDLGVEPYLVSASLADVLAQEVRDVVAALSADERVVCAGLAAGQSISRIAHQLQCTWHTVRRIIDRLREHFIAIGLELQLDG